MPFELSLFGPGEHSLFCRLPLGDRNMGFGAVGHIRAELGWYSFYRMWCPERKSLDNPAFHSELNALLRELRGIGGALHSCPDLSKFLQEAAQPVGNNEKGFKIQTADYSYYIRCRMAERCDYDITIYAYDNSFLLPELAGKHKLPDHCFSVLPDCGTLVILQRERPYIQSFESNDSVDVRRQVSNDLNEAMGVTKAQAAAMLMGALHGFDQPCAWPWQYNQNGELRSYDKPRHNDKEAR